LILEKSAEDVDDVLLNGAQQGNEELVKVALDRGGATAETLTVALITSTEAKNAPISEMLTKAGAKPPIQIEATTLQSYAGKYKGDPGPEATVTVQDGKLMVAGFSRQPQPLMPLDNTTFRPIAFGGLKVVFNVEAGKVTGMAIKQGNDTTQLKRID
jgi:hypothetical protein